MTQTVYRVLFRDGAIAEQGRVPEGAPATPGTEARIVPDALASYVRADWVPHPILGAAPTGPALEVFRAALLTRLAACRWSAQVRGVEIDGKRWHSDAEGRSSLVESAVLSAEWEAAHPDQPWQTDWKTADGFIRVNRAQLIQASFRVAAHVQAVFAREALLSAQIANGNYETLAALAAEIEGGW
jgi:hypothetical protein